MGVRADADLLGNLMLGFDVLVLLAGFGGGMGTRFQAMRKGGSQAGDESWVLGSGECQAPDPRIPGFWIMEGGLVWITLLGVITPDESQGS